MAPDRQLYLLRFRIGYSRRYLWTLLLSLLSFVL